LLYQRNLMYKLPLYTVALLWVLASCMVCIPLYSQPSNLGNPPVVNYPKSQTLAGTQTWAIEEDPFGYTWFANNQGVLKFDGYRWELLRIANKTIVRSLACDKNEHKIYVGGQGEFGYFSPDARGVFRYTSLSATLDKKHQGFGDVWHTLVTAQGVFFRTDHQVFRYAGQKSSPLFGEDQSFNFISRWGRETVLQDSENRLYVFDGRRFVPRSKNSHFFLGRITAVLPHQDTSSLIVTLHNGIFEETPAGFAPWKTEHDEYLRSRVAYCAGMMADRRIIIGTTDGGLFIINRDRQIEAHLNKKTGLQNNTVLSIAGTRGGNVWLGLDNGIDLVKLTSAFREFYPDGELQGAGYSAAMHQQQLYLGTNTGLYAIPWKTYYTPAEKNAFRAVAGTGGQVWKLQELGGELLMGHHEGGFVIEGLNARKITSTYGIWKFVPMPGGNLLAGHYEGLIALQKSASGWVQAAAVRGFSESSRILETDAQQNLWMAHPYRGVFRIEAAALSELSVKKSPLFVSNSTPAKPLLNHIFKINGEMVVSDAEQFYAVQPDDLSLQPVHWLKTYIPVAGDVKFMVEDDYKNIWYATQRETGLLVPRQTFQKGYDKYVVNALNNRLPEGFQSVFTIDPYNVVFPTDKGFILFNPSSYLHDTLPPELFISDVILSSNNQDSTIFSGALSNQKDAYTFDLSRRHNNLLLRYSVRNAAEANALMFSHRIGSEHAAWSEWSAVPQINLSQLSPGSYQVAIKAKSQNGVESKILQLRIHIHPPWYLHPLALFLYALAVVWVVRMRIRRLKKRHHIEKKSIIAENLEKEKGYLLDAEMSREEINLLKNEKLEAELNFKNQELISYTYHLVNKNELISEIKRALHKLEPKFEHDHELKKEYRHIIQLIEQNADVDSDWGNFMLTFDQVHSDFFKRLTSQFHHLSPNDYKMCIYLRMNLTSKEIAALMNISIRSVETNRYRLRKKLGLHPDENLTQFLLRY
jgi:DNA-binding CsgD family transcriptional regulator